MGDSYTVYSAIKRPDLVVQHALGSGAHLVIDVKTVDGTGSTAIERSHTDVSALGGLTEVERALWDEYTDSGRRPDAIPAGCHLICAAVGRHGGIGAGMIELINRCARTRGNAPGAGEHFSEFETYFRRRMAPSVLPLGRLGHLPTYPSQLMQQRIGSDTL